MHISSLNVRSARANNAEILDYLHVVEPHCLCVQETWGYTTQCQGYDYITNHRPSRGGGVAIIFKKSTKLKVKERVMDRNLEAIVAVNNRLTLVNIYRPPKGDVTDFCRLLKELIFPYKNNSRNIIIAGDFNVDFLTNTRQKQLIIDTCLDINLILPHALPSRVTDTSSTQIDAIFCNSNSTEATGTFATMISDHYNPYIVVNNCKLNDPPTYITFRNTKEENMNLVREELSSIEWNLDDLPVNVAYNTLITKIRDTYDKYCPLKKRKVDLDKMAIQTFMTKGLLTSRVTKNKLIANYNRKRTPEKREKLRAYVKIFKQLCKLSDIMDTETFLKNNANNSRKIWQMAKGKLGLSRLQDSLTESMTDENGTLLTKDKDIADNLNKFFVNIGTDLTKTIPSVIITENTCATL